MSLYDRERTTLVYGPAGSGKSFTMLRRLLNYLETKRSGRVVTNLPLDLEAIDAWAEDQWGEENVSERIDLIPLEVIEDWKAGRGGPWEWFGTDMRCEGEGGSLEGTLLLIDECHTVCSRHNRRHKGAWVQKWQSFCGWIRHEKAYVEFASQDISKIARELIAEAAYKLVITSLSKVTDKWVGISFYDWGQLWGMVFGTFHGGCRVDAKMKVEEKWQDGPKSFVYFNPRVFELYRSFSAPNEGDEEFDESPELMEFQEMSRSRLVLWFVSRNWLSLVVAGIKLSLIVAALWFFTRGIGPTVQYMSDKAKETWERQMEGVDTSRRETSGPTATPPPRHAADVPDADRLRQLEAELRDRDDLIEQLQTEYGVAAEENRELRERVERDSMVALVTPDECLLRDGTLYRVGDVIERGSLAGLSIAEIDVWGRRVLLSDGTVLRSGRDVLAEGVIEETIASPTE